MSAAVEPTAPSPIAPRTSSKPKGDNDDDDDDQNCCSCGSLQLRKPTLYIPGRSANEARHVWFNIDVMTKRDVQRLRWLWFFVLMAWLAVVLTADRQFDCFNVCDFTDAEQCQAGGVRTSAASCVNFSSTLWLSSSGIQLAVGDVYQRSRRIIYWEPGVGSLSNDTIASFHGAQFLFLNATNETLAVLPVNVTATGSELLTLRINDEYDIPSGTDRIAVQLTQPLPINSTKRNPSLTFLALNPNYVTAEIAIRYTCFGISMLFLAAFLIGHATRDQVEIHLQDFALRAFVKDYVFVILLQVCCTLFADPLVAARYNNPADEGLRYWSDHFVFLLMAVFVIFTSTWVSISLADIGSAWKVLLRTRAIFIAILFSGWYIALDSVAWVNSLAVSELLFGFTAGSGGTGAENEAERELVIVGRILLVVGIVWLVTVTLLFTRNKDRVFWNKGRVSYRGKVRVRVLALRVLSSLASSFAVFYFAIGVPLQVTFADFTPLLGRTAIGDVVVACAFGNIALWFFSVKSHRSIVAPESPHVKEMKLFYLGNKRELQVLEVTDASMSSSSSSASSSDSDNNGEEEQQKSLQQQQQQPGSGIYTSVPSDANLDEELQQQQDFSPALAKNTDDGNNKEKKPKLRSSKDNSETGSIADVERTRRGSSHAPYDDDDGDDGQEDQLPVIVTIPPSNENLARAAKQQRQQQQQQSGGGHVVVSLASQRGKKARRSLRRVASGNNNNADDVDEQHPHHHHSQTRLVRAAVGTARVLPDGPRWTSENFEFIQQNSSSGFFFVTEREKIDFDDAHAMMATARSFFCWETCNTMLSLSEAVYYDAPQHFIDFEHESELTCCVQRVEGCIDCLLGNEDDGSLENEEARMEDEAEAADNLTRGAESVTLRNDDDKNNKAAGAAAKFKATSKDNENAAAAAAEASNNKKEPPEKPEPLPADDSASASYRTEHRSILDIEEYGYKLLRILKVNNVQVVIALFAPDDAVGPTLYSRPGVWAPDVPTRTQGRSIDESVYRKQPAAKASHRVCPDGSLHKAAEHHHQQQQQQSQSQGATPQASSDFSASATFPSASATSATAAAAAAVATAKNLGLPPGHRRRTTGSQTDYKLLDTVALRFGGGGATGASTSSTPPQTTPASQSGVFSSGAAGCGGALAAATALAACGTAFGRGNGSNAGSRTTSPENTVPPQQQQQQQSRSSTDSPSGVGQQQQQPPRPAYKRIAHLAVIFRGTSNRVNLATNCDFSRAIFREMRAASSGAATVHAGFEAVWASCKEPVFAAVDHYLTLLQHRKLPVNFVGHSSGGTLSCLAAYSFRREFPTHPVYVYTFGQPRFGNETFRKLYNKACPETYRVVCENDFVPGLQHCGRVHVGRGVMIDRDGNYILEPNGVEHWYRPLEGKGGSIYNHRLKRYAAALQAIFRSSVKTPFKTFLTVNSELWKKRRGNPPADLAATAFVADRTIVTGAGGEKDDAKNSSSNNNCSANTPSTPAQVPLGQHNSSSFKTASNRFAAAVSYETKTASGHFGGSSNNSVVGMGRSLSQSMDMSANPFRSRRSFGGGVGSSNGGTPIPNVMSVQASAAPAASAVDSEQQQGKDGEEADDFDVEIKTPRDETPPPSPAASAAASAAVAAAAANDVAAGADNKAGRESSSVTTSDPPVGAKPAPKHDSNDEADDDNMNDEIAPFADDDPAAVASEHREQQQHQQPSPPRHRTMTVPPQRRNTSPQVNPLELNAPMCPLDDTVGTGESDHQHPKG